MSHRRRLLRRLAAMLGLAASVASALGAADTDPLKSEGCRAALAALEQRIAEPATEARAGRIAAAREAAALACLGRSRGSAVRSGAPDPLRTVPPPLIAPPAAAAAPTAPAYVPAPALAIPRPTVITTCDPAGCWDSEGRRLDSLGPLLMSPRGPCTVQGGVAICP